MVEEQTAEPLTEEEIATMARPALVLAALAVTNALRAPPSANSTPSWSVGGASPGVPQITSSGAGGGRWARTSTALGQP